MLSGCTTQNVVHHRVVAATSIIVSDQSEYDIEEWESFTNEDSNFKVTTYINDVTHRKDEPIYMFSEVEYIGEDDEIIIWSGEPNFFYTIYDGEDYYCEDLRLDILQESRFVKGTVYKYPFVKAGAWGDEDENSSYWKNYYSEPELILPAGNYEVTAYKEYSLTSDNSVTHKLEVKFNQPVRNSPILLGWG